MKTTVKLPTEIEITHIIISVPVRYGDEDIPYDFPLRSSDTWQAVVEVDTGKITDWPQGQKGELHMKVCDEGTYTLLGPAGQIAKIEENYVPNDIVPGEYGDYIELSIDENGIITNWPKRPDVSAFFEEE